MLTGPFAPSEFTGLWFVTLVPRVRMYRIQVPLFTFTDFHSMFRLFTEHFRLVVLVILRVVRECWICAPDSTVIHKPLCHS